MARLKIGSGIRLEAQLPKVEQSEPSLGEKVSNLNMKELLDELLSMMPPTKTPEEVFTAKETDLSNLITKSQMDEAVLKLINERARTNGAIDELDDRVNLLEEQSERVIQLPEVKQVTHVQDVSPEVLKKCQEMIRHSEINVMSKVSDLQRKNNKQKIINYVLGSVLVLTVFLHLL